MIYIKKNSIFYNKTHSPIADNKKSHTFASWL